MKYHRLCTSLALIGLLVPAGTAWTSGLENEGEETCTRESELMHICQGGERVGQECTVEKNVQAFNNQCVIVEPPGCPNGTCVVKYFIDQKPRPGSDAPTPNLPLLAHGTLTIIADAHPASINQPGHQTQAVLLEVLQPEFSEQAGRPQFFANIDLIRSNSREKELVIVKEANGLNLFPDSFLFRQAQEMKAGEDLSRSLKQMFGAPSDSIPVIADVREPLVVSPHTDSDTLGTVVSLRVEIGFAFLRPGARPAADPEEDE
jgi:hypothetical protein